MLKVFISYVTARLEKSCDFDRFEEMVHDTIAEAVFARGMRGSSLPRLSGYRRSVHSSLVSGGCRIRSRKGLPL